jgi:ThiF family
LDFKDGRVEFDWSRKWKLAEAHVAGIGAIGSSFLYSLAAHGRAEGKLVLVDHDRVEISNLGRYTFFDANDEGAYKTIAAKARLDKLELPVRVETVEKRFERYFSEAYAADNRFRVERLISAPDKRSTRRAFQRTLPRGMWDASTGPGQISLHTNTFDPAYACTECIYPETPEESAHERHVAEALNVDLERVHSGEPITEADAQRIVERYPGYQRGQLVGKAFDSVFRELCSVGEIRTTRGVVHAPLSFVSGLAGVLLYFELVKSCQPETFGPFQNNYNYFQINPFRQPNPEFRELRESRKECTCQHEVVRKVYRKLWSELPGGSDRSDS